MTKVLVVDDIADNLKLLQYDLEDDGYIVYTSQDGKEAVEKACKIKPDIILLDIMMPVMDGIEACKVLKSKEGLAEIPVIMLSAKGRESDIILGLDAGATDYVTKPINYKIVAARIRAALRTKELNESLQKQVSITQAALRARSSFFATMSHEIRTPITAIMGLAEIIMNEDEFTVLDTQQASRMVLSNSRYLLEIINNILDLSKAESGELEIENINCSIFEIMNDVESVVNLKAIEKGILFLIDYTYPLPSNIISDPTKIKQIIINLVGNAIKFTDKGHVKVTISFNNDSKEIELKVSDTGIGMNEEELRKIFQPFKQANNSISRRFGGSGLGLTITEKIVKKLKGNIVAISKINSGTEFTVRIPTNCTDTTPLATRNPLFEKQEYLESEQLNFRGKVLVVEDSNINQMLITHLLNKVGLEAEIAETGKSAIEKAVNSKFDLIFMDIHLPELSGLEATKEIRKKEICVPIIALSASYEIHEIQEIISAGCQEYLPKPFRREQLFDCLKRYLPELNQNGHLLDQINIISENDENYSKLVLKYIDKLHIHLKNIQEYYNNEEWQKLRTEANQLAGAGVYGFPKISLAAKLLEEQSVNRNQENCKEIIERVSTIISNIN